MMTNEIDRDLQGKIIFYVKLFRFDILTVSWKSRNGSSRHVQNTLEPPFP
jgi:hypothetical protein